MVTNHQSYSEGMASQDASFWVWSYWRQSAFNFVKQHLHCGGSLMCSYANYLQTIFLKKLKPDGTLDKHEARFGNLRVQAKEGFWLLLTL